MYGKQKFLLPLMSLLMAPVRAEDVTTITETNYITPAWFMDAIETALVNNPQSQDSGLEIVFVNGDVPGGPNAAPSSVSGVPAQPQATYITSSDMAYLVKSGDVVYTSTAPVTFTTTGAVQTNTASTVPTDATTKGTNQAKKPEERSTLYEYETATDVSNVYVQLTKTAQTTTKTVFTASTVPKTIYQGSTSYQTITKTIENPVPTGTVVTKTRTNRISVNSDSFSDGVTFSASSEEDYSSAEPTSFADASDSELPSSSAPADSYIVSPNVGKAVDSDSGPSTIDLRISSSYVSSGFGSSTMVYSNSSIASSEFVSASDFEIESSSLSPVAAVAAVATSSAGVSSSAAKSSSSVASSSASSSAASATSIAKAKSNGGGDLFKAIDGDKPMDIFKREALPLEIPSNVDNDGVPYQTNKFYANLFLGEQTNMIWSYPYGLQFKNQDYYGLGLQHTNVSQRIFGPKNKANDGDSYFFNPTGVSDLVLSATDLDKGSNYMGVTDMKSMSVKVTFSASKTVGSDYVEMPIVQGMGFVTAIYHGDMTARLNTLVGINNVEQESSSALESNILKYRVTLFDGVQYLVYAILPDQDSDFDLKVDDSFNVEASKSIDGLVIQVATAPEKASDDGYYDEAAGMYATSASVSGSSSGSSAEYSFEYDTKGSSSSGKTMVFALPHHVQSFSSSTKDRKTPIKMASTTKGEMVGLLSNEITLSETIESNVQFLPWAPIMEKDLSYDSEQLSLLADAAQEELDVDIKSTVNGMDSNYFSGKVMDKYANILLVVHDIIGDKKFAQEVLDDLKDAFSIFTDNKQHFPLMYDTKFGGITSSASQDGDTGVDFGSAYYNDHHFHYGYFIHAAAVVGYVDKELGGSWAEDNKEWVNNLIRDVANPSEDDTHFPVSRMFDWFAGHSWAGGLFDSGDGRNEESSSEDYHFSYGMKLWGKVIKDSSMEGRGDLMLAVMNRALNNYFYFSDDNEVIPKELKPNKVSGIFFDNKVAFTTYFGDADEYPQYVHGIHMIPMTAAAALIRGTEYVKQEWEENVSKFIDDLDDNWAGILHLNQALFDPKSSYKFFSDDGFNTNSLDNGQSRTWSLAFAGGLLNSS